MVRYITSVTLAVWATSTGSFITVIKDVGLHLMYTHSTIVHSTIYIYIYIYSNKGNIIVVDFVTTYKTKIKIRKWPMNALALTLFVPMIKPSIHHLVCNHSYSHKF